MEAVNEEHDANSANGSQNSLERREGQSQNTHRLPCARKKKHSGTPQMETDGRGVSQQERQRATEVINQPLGIVCRQSASRVKTAGMFQSTGQQTS